MKDTFDDLVRTLTNNLKSVHLYNFRKTMQNCWMYYEIRHTVNSQPQNMLSKYDEALNKHYSFLLFEIYVICVISVSMQIK